MMHMYELEHINSADIRNNKRTRNIPALVKIISTWPVRSNTRYDSELMAHEHLFSNVEKGNLSY